MNETTSNVPAAIPYQFDHGGDDGFALVATPTAATFRAEYLDFKQGDWLRGRERVIVTIGTQYIPHAMTEGWVYLKRDEPVRRIPREPGKPFPQRNELDNADKSQWPLYQGEPSDPWTLQNEILMTDRETGLPVIFRATSWSAREVTQDFARLVTYQQRQRGNSAKPIVAIGVATRSHSKGSYKVPVFEIVGWVGSEMVPEPAPSQLQNDLSEQLQARSALSGTERTTAPQKSPSRRKKAPPAPWDNDDDLDDEIPL